ncbi:MAG TPA: hypothetical protein V6C58_19625 [Allocoleopsis sp.]
MKRGIVITTHKSTKPFFDDLIKSLKDCKYPICIVDNTEINHFEKGGLLVGMKNFDEFIYLHDTVIIKNLELFDILFSKEGFYSISPGFLMYLGKYDSKKLSTLNLPSVNSKYDAILMELWLKHNIPCDCFDKTFIDGNHRFEERHGRKNMVLENDYLIKYKGTWDINMVKVE